MNRSFGQIQKAIGSLSATSTPCRVQLVPLVRQVQPVVQVPLVPRVLLVLLERLVRQVLLVPKAQPV